jgi:hypothetical protein
MKKTIFISLSILIFLLGCTTENPEEIHDYSVEIEGKDMRLLSVKKTAELWEINPDILLKGIIEEFNLKENHTIKSTIDEIREEYKFSPALIKEIAENIKQQSINKTEENE